MTLGWKSETRQHLSKDSMQPIFWKEKENLTGNFDFEINDDSAARQHRLCRTRWSPKPIQKTSACVRSFVCNDFSWQPTGLLGSRHSRDSTWYSAQTQRPIAFARPCRRGELGEGRGEGKRFALSLPYFAEREAILLRTRSRSQPPRLWAFCLTLGQDSILLVCRGRCEKKGKSEIAQRNVTFACRARRSVVTFVLFRGSNLLLSLRTNAPRQRHHLTGRWLRILGIHCFTTDLVI